MSPIPQKKRPRPNQSTRKVDKYLNSLIEIGQAAEEITRLSSAVGNTNRKLKASSKVLRQGAFRTKHEMNNTEPD